MADGGGRRRAVVAVTLSPRCIAEVDLYARAQSMTRSRAVERLLLRELHRLRAVALVEHTKAETP